MQGLVHYAFGLFNDMKQSNQEAIDRLYERWDESRKLPRKKKKAERKRILELYSIHLHMKDTFFTI